MNNPMRNFRKQGVPGSVRKGIRGDIRLVHSTDRPDQEKEPTAAREAALITSVRYYGEREGDSPAEAMTATSAALYEYLMARGRPTLEQNDTFMVSYADAKAYLQIDKTSRLLKCMSALCSTWVSYEFMDKDDGYRMIGRRVQLLNCLEAIPASGERYIAVEMYPSVRKAILESEVYAHLELGAFPRFSSKYTSRLYPRLALMAGRDQRPPFRWTPEELAEIVGWKPTGNFKFSNFESRVLQPVLADLKEHVRRFGVSCEYVRAATRGRPVSEIVITVGKAMKTSDEYQKSSMTRSDRTTVGKIATAAAVDIATQMPGEDTLRRAATRLQTPVTAVAALWTDAFAEPLIMSMLERDGLESAFEQWLQQQVSMQGEDGEVEFSAATTILLDLAEGYDLAVIQKAIDDHLWTGSAAKTIRIRWTAESAQHQHDITVSPTERDLALLLRNNADIIEDLEYVA